MTDEKQKEYLEKVQEYWKEDRDRLVRWSVLQTMFLICLLVGIAAYGSYQLRLLKSQVNSLASSQHVRVTELSPTQFKELKLSLAGSDGLDGQDGTPGTDGRDGINGVNGRNGVGTPGPQGLPGTVTSDMVAAAVLAIMEANPDKYIGPQGENGEPGQTVVVFVRENPLTRLLECRRGEDISWLPIVECSQ